MEFFSFFNWNFKSMHKTREQTDIWNHTGRIEALGARQIPIPILPQMSAGPKLFNKFLNFFVVGQGQDCCRLNEVAKN